jgi:hypothetical protein
MGAVAAPGIALMVVSTIDLLVNGLMALIGIVLEMSAPPASPARPPEAAALSIAPLCCGLVVRFASQIVIFLGALSMTRLKSYGFSMAAAIMATIPGLSACCLIGVPFGLWALNVLKRQDVKDAFS